MIIIYKCFITPLTKWLRIYDISNTSFWRENRFFVKVGNMDTCNIGKNKYIFKICSLLEVYIQGARLHCLSGGEVFAIANTSSCVVVFTYNSTLKNNEQNTPLSKTTVITKTSFFLTNMARYNLKPIFNEDLESARQFLIRPPEVRLLPCVWPNLLETLNIS